VKWQTISKRSAATAAKASGWVCATGPVELQVEFCFARPKSHYGTGKRSNILKPSAPLCHIQKPDRTKLLRCIEDAFKGVLWEDDSQVISGAVSKRWGKEDYATVTAKIAEARC
jgi:Holliday junction resolvase RusA-like endonuclease